MTDTVKALSTIYPRRSGTMAVTGFIPIDIFESMKDNLREDMRRRSLRIQYRGPRQITASGKPSQSTQRVDATHVVLYYK